MKKLVYGMAAAAAMLTATSASAAISFIPGSAAPLPGSTLIADFDTTNGPLSGSGFVIQPNTDVEGAQPAFGLQGNYLSVLGGGVATFTFATAVNDLSFIYGSADTYNSLTVFFNGGASSQTFTGSQIVGAGNATGNRFAANSNGTVLLSGFTGGITRLQLNSGQNSFEIDNLRANAVPEPGTWAMMLLGFGAVGFAMRRRGKSAFLPQAA